MTSKHTPGPWLFRKWATSDEDVELAKRHGLEPVRMLTNEGAAVVGHGAFIGDSDYKPIAHVLCQTTFKRGQGYKAECAERDANTRLIAEAPAMYETLRKVAKYFVHVDAPLGIEARAILNRIDGE